MSSRAGPRATPLAVTQHEYEQQAEPDHTFHGEFFDTMDAIGVVFELEDARRVVAESEKGAEHLNHSTEGTSVPDQDSIEEAHQRKKFTIHPTCASAYALLLQRRCTSLREVSLCTIFGALADAGEKR